MKTTEVRFADALKSIRKQGIIAKRNVMECCRSCVDLGIADNVPVIWHFGGQGNRLTIEGNYANDESVYFNHDNLFDPVTNKPNNAGERVIQAFQDNGFEIVDLENLSNAKCLEVKLTAGKEA